MREQADRREAGSPVPIQSALSAGSASPSACHRKLAEAIRTVVKEHGSGEVLEVDAEGGVADPMFDAILEQVRDGAKVDPVFDAILEQVRDGVKVDPAMENKMHRTRLRTPPVNEGTVNSTWMGPIRQVLNRISGEYRDFDSITVQCPHDGRADKGLRYQTGPPAWHWSNRHGERGWPLVHCCFCKRCTHAMKSYEMEDELPLTDGKPLDDYDAKAHEACYP